MKKKQLLGGVLEEVQLPNNQAYYDRLHDKIMARVEDAEMETPTRQPVRTYDKTASKLLRDHWRGWLYSRES
ncbi:hypothetical protein [Bdellovibrio sp. HCB337]|uniref:hypothetical protein n=1 Tax=Bdellovibrio sp. HCB337 TaxID=3394358 RepID=UPI0039A76A0F